MEPSIRLNDRLYDFSARERIRQLSLWSPQPVFVYVNCGIPFGMEESVEEEIRIFQQEGVIKFWGYEDEPAYDSALSSIIKGRVQTVSDHEYKQIINFVDSRLTEVFPDLQSLGFKNMEGMMLEQVVLRRRFFSQALCGALGASTLADTADYTDLYKRSFTIHSQVEDTLQQFFNAINVPSLALLDIETFLTFREKSKATLTEIVGEVHGKVMGSGARQEQAQQDAVMHLIRRYQSELLTLLKSQRGSSTRNVFSAYESGTLTQLESQVALFFLNDSLTSEARWFVRDQEGRCKLALLLLEWKSGKLGTKSRCRASMLSNALSYTQSDLLRI